MASRSYATDAVVLRSIRFGEADRVLHLYTAERGRIGAVAKGVRKTKSRFGARREPRRLFAARRRRRLPRLREPGGGNRAERRRRPRDRGAAREPARRRDLPQAQRPRPARRAARRDRELRVPRRLSAEDAFGLVIVADVVRDAVLEGMVLLERLVRIDA